jgi:4-amino-4-deoxychorismate lyase
VYAEEIELVEFTAYQRRKVESVRLIAGGDIEYSYKYADRSAIDRLFAQKMDCDDILIMKDSLITDTSTANVAFFDGHHWFTPDTPLLKGTKRQQLLDTGRIAERTIRRPDMAQYTHFTWFNAMNDFDPTRALPVSRIFG